MYHKILSLLLLSIIPLFSAGHCVTPQSPHVPITLVPQYSDLLSDVECYIGCWKGLRPGFSSIDQVIEMGFTRSNIASDSYIIYTRSDAVAILSLDQRLLAIELLGPITLTLGQVIQSLGMPEYYSQGIESGSEIPNNYGAIQFYYPTFGLWFYSDSRGGISITSNSDQDENICIAPSNLVVQVIIVEPGSLEEVLQRINNPFREIDTTSLVQELQMQEWNGFSCN